MPRPEEEAYKRRKKRRRIRPIPAGKDSGPHTHPEGDMVLHKGDLARGENAMKGMIHKRLPYRPSDAKRWRKTITQLTNQLRTGGKHGLTSQELQMVRGRNKLEKLPVPKGSPEDRAYINRRKR